MSTVVQATGLTKGFRGCDALQGVDLKVPAGVVFALLGENGAGKTTLIRILTGFLPADAGRARILDLDCQTQSMQIRRRVGYVSDAPALYDWMTAAQIGWFTSAFYPDGFQLRYRELIAQFEVPLSRKLKRLSKGQRAKVALALAVAHEPELLILDEPAGGLVRRPTLAQLSSALLLVGLMMVGIPVLALYEFQLVIVLLAATTPPDRGSAGDLARGTSPRILLSYAILVIFIG